jgi:hypothetical protein
MGVQMVKKVTDDAAEIADKVELAMGLILRAEQIAATAKTAKTGAKEYMKNAGLDPAAVAYAMKHRGDKAELLDRMREEEDTEREMCARYLDLVRSRNTPIERLIAKAGGYRPEPEPGPEPAGSVVSLHPAGRA